MKLRWLVLSVVSWCAVLSLRAEVSLAPLFRDRMVLQRERPVPVWGRAKPGEKLTVRFGDQQLATRADADGRWRVDLAALAASGTPADLVVQGQNTLTVRDVLVGEVWLAGGQSNMEWPVRLSHAADAEAATADFPAIRHFKVEKTIALAPGEQVNGQWVAATPQSALHFSAIGFFFARDLHKRLGVPVGIIDSTWGGTDIEAWLSPPALAATGLTDAVAQRWAEFVAGYPELVKKHVAATAAWEAEAAAAQAKGEPFTKDKPWLTPGPGGPNTPHALFHGMVAPLAPFAVRGVLWYQGENNAGRAGQYAALFRALIRDWRGVFEQAELPFFFVQLANWAPGGGWPELRAAQAEVLDLPGTGMALALDVGDARDIHPKNKQEVARRLALLARNRVYDLTCDDSGPVVERAAREGAGVRVRFKFADGLNARSRPLQTFEVAGADGKWVAATARLDGASVFVTAPGVPAPVRVRYAWSPDPAANLYNGAGLPAVPFQLEVK